MPIDGFRRPGHRVGCFQTTGVRCLVFARASAGCRQIIWKKHQKAWRYWSFSEPSLHQAMYQFPDKAALERAINSEDMKRLIADFKPRLARRDAHARDAGAGGGVWGVAFHCRPGQAKPVGTIATGRNRLRDAVSSTVLHFDLHGVWVPAFAGTTVG